MKALNTSTVNKPILPVKVLQFGEGNFLRAFVDWMFQKANKKGILHHGIVVVQPIEQGITELLNKQDCLYHVYLEGIKDKQPYKEVTLIKSINKAFNPYTEYVEYEKVFLSDDLEIIISNTTEAGIRYEEGDDLNALPPKSYPAKMTVLLYQRWKKFNGDPSKGLMIICCELIDDNGSTLKKYILQHAEYHKLDKEFVNWLNTACHFYDSIVDRIVPGFPKDTINEIKEEIGFDDNLVVKGEYFHFWAIAGDAVIKEKLPFDKMGLNVQYLDDIHLPKMKKVRILNGSHTAMVSVALQLGCDTVKEAFAHPLVEKYINSMVSGEVLPMIPDDMAELKRYSYSILERFYNPFIKHQLRDISLNSISKWETRNYPTIKDNYKNGKKAPLATFSLAALLVLYASKHNIDFTPKDTVEYVEFIKNTFDEKNIDQWVEGILAHPMWVEPLNQLDGFTEVVTTDVKLILEKGMEAALRNVI
ncbi:MAG: tagaturonate reductase [Bacteroidales bacterium]|nr:tagaturonate reductase [Bacteroidales bacterium]